MNSSLIFAHPFLRAVYFCTRSLESSLFAFFSIFAITSREINSLALMVSDSEVFLENAGIDRGQSEAVFIQVENKQTNGHPASPWKERGAQRD